MPSDDGYDLDDIIQTIAKRPRDPEQWRLLHARLWPYVMALNSRNLGGAGHLVEDASQEVFLRLVRYAPFERLANSAALYAYVRKMCANVATNYRIHLSRLREVQTEEGSTEEHPESRASHLDIEAHRLERDLLSQLHEGDRRLATLMLDGHSLGEIAESFGIAYSSAGVRVHRLRRRIAGLMRSLSENPSDSSVKNEG